MFKKRFGKSTGNANFKLKITTKKEYDCKYNYSFYDSTIRIKFFKISIYLRGKTENKIKECFFLGFEPNVLFNFFFLDSCRLLVNLTICLFLLFFCQIIFLTHLNLLAILIEYKVKGKRLNFELVFHRNKSAPN